MSKPHEFLIVAMMASCCWTATVLADDPQELAIATPESREAAQSPSSSTRASNPMEIKAPLENRTSAQPVLDEVVGHLPAYILTPSMIAVSVATDRSVIPGALGICSSCFILATPGRVFGDRGGEFQVSARLDLRSAQGVSSRDVKSEDTVHSGDLFSLSFWVDQSVYIYAIDYQEKGWSQLLFSQSTPVDKKERIRLPKSGAPYKFNDQVGQEHIYIYASRTPMDDATCARLRLPCSVSSKRRTRGEDPAPLPPPPPPKPPKRIERGGRVIAEGNEILLRGSSDAAGTVLLRYELNHTP